MQRSEEAESLPAGEREPVPVTLAAADCAEPGHTGAAGSHPRWEYPVSIIAVDRPRTWSNLLWIIAGVTSICITAGIAAIRLETEGYHTPFLLAQLAASAAAIVSFWRAWQVSSELDSRLSRLERKYGEMYGRAGISIWQEDWSAVGEAIARLRMAGVTDIPAWYAVRPEEARALHSRVSVIGVNRQSVDLMRAKTESDLIGSLAVVLPGSFATFNRWLTAFCRDELVYVGESVIQRCDGEPFDCFVTAALPKRAEDYKEIILSIVEITAYKRDQVRLAEVREEIARSQRIATVGALTASIAHEINSPLAAVASNAAACRRWLERPDPDLEEAKSAVSSVITDVERVCSVIDRTRGYLQKTERTQERKDLRKLISDSVRLVDREASIKEITVSLDIAEDVGMIVCDTVHLQQAFVNLMVNAIQAMGDSDREKRLLITVKRQEGWFIVTVEDTGPGIPESDLRRIFEPFYSTKNGGMGMGLSICRTAVEAHGGTLTAHSTPGKGSRFEVKLPVTTA